MAILKKDFSNLETLIGNFFEENENQLDIGIIVPHTEELEKLYI